MNKDLTPKQFIKITQRLDKRGLAICDGTTANMQAADPWFIVFIMLMVTSPIWGGKVLNLLYRIKAMKNKKRSQKNE